MGGLSLHLSVRRGAGSAQKRPLWRYSDLGEWGRQWEAWRGRRWEREENKSEGRFFCNWPAILSKQSDVCTVQQHKMTLHTVHVEADDRCVWSIPSLHPLLLSLKTILQSLNQNLISNSNLAVVWKFLWHLIWQDNTPSLHNRHAVDYKMCFFCLKGTFPIWFPAHSWWVCGLFTWSNRSAYLTDCL